MRILYLINHAGKAGTEKYVYNLAKTYHGKRASCFFAYNEEGPLLQDMQSLGIPSCQVKMRSPWDLNAAKKLAKLCDRYRIDIIHTQYPRENYVAVLSRLFRPKTKVIYTCHLTLKTNFLWRIANSIITRFDAQILSVCNNGKDLLIQNGVKPEKIKVVYNGLSVQETQSEPSTIREELGLSADTFVAVTLARYHIAKGLPYLVDSIAEVSKDIPFVCLIAGDGELFDEIRERIKEKGLEDRILQLGYRNDAANLLAGADVFINSAKCYEALSFAILEALGAGLPVIATNIGGNGDIINPENNCGILVEYGDTKGMANAIESLATHADLCATYGKNGKMAIETVFNLDKILEIIYTIYVDVLNKMGK
ncbi:MAG: glycosyltransferase [Clostridia bacterium]|nr:glycosyltransferase [Clostridia bacterium]